MQKNKVVTVHKFYTTIKYGGVETKLQTFLTSAPDGGKWSASHSGCFTSGIN